MLMAAPLEPAAAGTRCASPNSPSSYESRTRFTDQLPPAACRSIVFGEDHAAGAFISLALSLARSEHFASCACNRPLAPRSPQTLPGFHRSEERRVGKEV